MDYEGSRGSIPEVCRCQRASCGDADWRLQRAAESAEERRWLLAYQPIQLYDTQNNFAPYANNQVPVVNPVAKFLFAHPEIYPLPNAAPTDGLLANNFQGSQRNFRVNDQGDVKIEWDPGNAQQVHCLLCAIERQRFVDGADSGVLSFGECLSDQAWRRQLDSYLLVRDRQ